MTDHRPEPLVPAEVDLRDFAFTPIYRARLFGSAFHAKCNDAEWRAGVTLWLKSQDQVPAGSLEPTFHLCGHPTITLSPYCAAHARKAFAPGYVRARRDEAAEELSEIYRRERVFA